MNLLYVSADRGISVSGTKGASIHLRQTVRALERCGVVWTVLCGGKAKKNDAGAETLEAEIVELPRPSAGRAPESGLSRELEALGMATTAPRMPELASVQFDAVYERYSLWSLAGAALAAERGVPLILEVNAPLPEEAARYRSLELQRLAEAIECEVLRRADVVLCVSSYLVQRSKELRGREGGVFLHGNVVDTEHFRPGERVRDEGQPSAFDVVFTGSLKPWHGVDRLIAAFSRIAPEIPGARLRVVGEGPEREALERQAGAAGISDRVVFHGGVSHEEVARLLGLAHVGVAPYPPLENFYFSPLKVVEYLAAGVAVVASRSGDLAEELDRRQAAILTAPGDVDQLAGALRRLYADPGLRVGLSERGRRLAVESFSLDASAARLVDRIRNAVTRQAEAGRRRSS